MKAIGAASFYAAYINRAVTDLELLARAALALMSVTRLLQAQQGLELHAHI